MGIFTAHCKGMQRDHINFRYPGDDRLVNGYSPVLPALSRLHPDSSRCLTGIYPAGKCVGIFMPVRHRDGSPGYTYWFRCSPSHLLHWLNFIQFLTGANVGIEEYFTREVLAIDPGAYGAGSMSPITAVSFLLICVAMVLLLFAPGHRAGLSSGLASVVVLVGLIVLMGYLYGTPQTLRRRIQICGSSCRDYVRVPGHRTYSCCGSEAFSSATACRSLDTRTFNALSSPGDIRRHLD